MKNEAETVSPAPFSGLRKAEPTSSLTRMEREWIEARARAAGFDLAGVAAVPPSDGERARETDRYFTEWVEAGYGGEMEWLKRRDAEGRLVRGDLRRAFPWARSVVVCAQNYNTQAPRSLDPAEPASGWIARYAWSGESEGIHEGGPRASDYHSTLLPRLKRLELHVRERFGANIQTRAYVDTGPLVERGYAALAGIGWIGKNTCVLNQEQGSWLLLGVLVMSLEVHPGAWALPAADRCGTCTRCLDACPTGALIGPRQMDASRCVSYLTIEHKGSIPEPLRAGMGRQVFGCDICQDVCPWNIEAPVSATHWPVREQLVNPALAWLAAMDGTAFNRWFKGSPLERTRRGRLLRNVAIAMGNSGDLSFLPRLRQWAGEAEEPTLAEAARWAAARLQAPRREDLTATAGPSVVP